MASTCDTHSADARCTGVAPSRFYRWQVCLTVIVITGLFLTAIPSGDITISFGFGLTLQLIGMFGFLIAMVVLVLTFFI